MRNMPGSLARRPSMLAALALFGAGLCLSVAAAPKAPAKPAVVPPELPAETLTASTIPDSVRERVYVADVAISHISDGRVRVFNAANGKLLGMISSAYVGNFTVSAKSDELYIATTHLSRSSRGERTDVLEVHDTSSLGFKYEVILPPKRAQALNYRGLVRASGNGKFVLVQNATPATSVTVVDLAGRKVVGEVSTPGCWGIMPAATHGTRFSTLCGDGKIATITLDDAGQVADRQVSDKLFDADKDAWFMHAEQQGDRYWFVSFNGQVTEMNLGGTQAQLKSTRSVVDAAGKRAGWRPGGYQNFAVDPSGQWMVLGMHDQGGEGSHKRPAKQLWVLDLSSGKRVATHPGHGTASLTFSRNGERLMSLDGEKGAMHLWRWGAGGKLTPLATVAKAGEASLHLESHD